MTQTQANEPGFVLVPCEPTEAMWGGLARDIVQWMGFSAPHYGSKLHDHLNALGRDIPDWLALEIPNIDHTPPKGTIAVAIFKAIISAAPAAPHNPSPAYGGVREPERCPECRGTTFAQVDDRWPGGGFRPGSTFRCVECKLVLPGISPVAVGEADADEADEAAFAAMSEAELLAGIDLSSAPSTPSPQIGKAGAGPVGEERLVDTIRSRGWAVAVHNDYRLNGEAHTFWLFTKDGCAAKGEGRTDAEALGHVVAAIHAIEFPDARPVEAPGEVEGSR